MIKRIVSGGQTGVDQGALEAALALGIPHGGWCPAGRICESGVISDKYSLEETDSPNYKVRTEQNVIDSDGTLILYRSKLSGGTAFTLRMAQKHDRPFLLVDLHRTAENETIVQWIQDAELETLNVAGPRESSAAGVFEESRDFLISVLRTIDN